MRPRGCAMALGSLLLWAPVHGWTRPYTVDDLLRQESFGAVAIAPGGRWLVFEQRDPYETAESFDYDQQNNAVLSRLRVVDLAKAGAVKPLAAEAAGPGMLIGPFSPDGERLAVYRLRDHRLTLGVVTLASGDVRWLNVAPERTRGRTVQWISATELIAIARSGGDPPRAFRLGWQTAATLPPRWAASARGDVARTAVGSGAYLQDRPKPAANSVLRINTLDGSVRQLAAGAFEALEVAPGAGVVALVEAGDDLQPVASQSLQDAWGTATQRRSVSILNLATGKTTRPCGGCDVLPSLLSWSSTGRELLVYAREAASPWTAGTLRRIDAVAGVARPVGQGKVRPVLDFRPEVVRAGWMSSDPVVLARSAAPGRGDRADWYRLAGREAVNLTARLAAPPRILAGLDATSMTLVADEAAWRIDRHGQLTRLSRTPIRPLAAMGRETTAPADPAAEPAVWAMTDSAAAPGVVRISSGTVAGPLALPGGRTEVRAYAGDARRLVAVVASRTDRGVRALDVITSNAPTLRLATINVGLADTDAPDVRPVDHTGPDGQRLRSWLYLPAKRPGRPPPLVVAPYSGAAYATPPSDADPVIGLVLNIRALVGHGYAVLVPSLPRPGGQTDPTTGLADRIQLIIDAAAVQPDLAGRFDASRTALWGHSYGGYTVMAVIGQTSRFKAAIESGGPSDLFGMWGAFQQSWRVDPGDGVWVTWSAGWVETVQGAMGSPPWGDPARYLRNSPWLSADRIVTPLLLLHGDQDPIPLTQAEMMFSALYRQGKDAVLVTYWGEGHFVCSPGNVRDLYARAFEWLDDHLDMAP